MSSSSTTLPPGTMASRLVPGPAGYEIVKVSTRGRTSKLVANFTARIVGQRQLHHHGDVRTELVLEIESGATLSLVTVPLEEFASERDGLYRALLKRGFPLLRLQSPHAGELRDAIQAHSQPTLPVNVYDCLGFVDDETFLAGDFVIHRGQFHDARRFNLSFAPYQGAPTLGLCQSDDPHVQYGIKALATQFVNMLNYLVTLPLLGHAFAAPWLSAPCMRDLPLPILQLVGSSGSGKTEAARLVQNLFGDFTLHRDLVSVESTTGYTGLMLHHFGACTCPFDDLTPANLSATDLVARYRQLQAAYGRGARGRLDGSLETRRPPEPQALPIVTSEQAPVGSAALISRSLIVETTNPQKDPVAYRECCRLAPLFRGVLASCIRYHLLTSASRLRPVFERLRREFRKEMGSSSGGDVSNLDRLAVNAAINRFGFILFLEFAHACGVLGDDRRDELRKKHLQALHVAIDCTQRAASDERPADIFIRLLSDLISTSEFRIYPPSRDKPEHGDLIETCGFWLQTGEVAVVSSAAYDAVAETYRRIYGRNFPHSHVEVGRQLFEAGFTRTRENGRTDVSRKFGKKSHRVWILPAEALGFDKDAPDDWRLSRVRRRWIPHHPHRPAEEV